MNNMNNNEKLAKIAVHKSLLKEYSNSSNERIVYMNDGTEFQIQIFNPYTYVIGVSFDFNNKSASSQMLVLKPGERVWLDRYLDKESKFLFSTYEVGTSKAIKEAIKNNGDLCIKFYKEKPNNWYNNAIYFTTYNDNNIKNYNDNYYKCYNNNITAVNTGTLFSSELSTTRAATNCTYTATTADSITTAASTIKPSSIETGRIEEGSHSNQKFTNVYKDFESWPFKTENIKILPMSQKQYNSNDLKKMYCHECGRKINQKFKFCPYCGAKL